jgi:hypothetical protein
MKCISILLGIALFALVAMPSVQAQVETPSEEPPVIPPDIAEALGGEGGLQSMVSLGLDILFVLVDLICVPVNGIIALVLDACFAIVNWILGSFTTVILDCWYEGSLLSCGMAWCNACFGCFPILTYFGGLTSAILCCMRYIPCAACCPNCWNAFKVTGQFFGI